MLGGVRLLLLQTIVVVLVPLSDPRIDSRRVQTISPRCQKEIADCGEFKPPTSDGAKIMRCKFNKKKCAFYCGFKCKKGPNDLKLRPSIRSRDHFSCVKGQWTRKDAPQGYCKAYYSVKEVHQNSPNQEQLDNLINSLMTSGYDYLAMASFYAGADIALPGFTKTMVDLWDESMKHAREIITYVQKRGDYFNPLPIPRPTAREDLLVYPENRKGLAGLERALNQTKSVNELVLEVVELAKETDENSDPHRKHFLEDSLLNYNIETIKKLADLIHRLQTFVDDQDYIIGEYTVDLELRK